MAAITYPGLVIHRHQTRDNKSKIEASQSLTGWACEQHTALDWIRFLSNGKTIQPSLFNPLSSGFYTHSCKTNDLWQQTHFICADADVLKGVEYVTNKDGLQTDKHPNGIDPFTDHKTLTRLYPTLMSKAFAIGQSVSSMTKAKPYRRYRIVFLFDNPITSIEHYDQILDQIASEFTIISTGRAPSQPVFGNARKGFNKWWLPQNILSLADYPLDANRFETKRLAEIERQEKIEAIKARRIKREEDRKRDIALLKSCGDNTTAPIHPIEAFSNDWNSNWRALIEMIPGVTHKHGDLFGYADSAGEIAFALYDSGAMTIFSETLAGQLGIPLLGTSGFSTIHASRFYIYLTYGLDIKSDSDKEKIAALLHSDGYGSSREDYLNYNRRITQAQRANFILPDYQSNLRYRINRSK